MRRCTPRIGGEMGTAAEYRCPKCGDKRSAKKRSHSIKYIHKVAEARGGRCLSSEYHSSKDHLQWQCQHGHRWTAQAKHVLAGHWCPKCGKQKLAKLFSLSIDDMRATAKERGGECLSRSYKNNRSRLRWRCQKGHEWVATAANIRRGSWCPACAGKKPKLK